jgi:hypothetical protein
VTAERFAESAPHHAAGPIVDELARMIAGELRLDAGHRSIAHGRFPGVAEPYGLRENSVVQYDRISRTLAFARRTRLGGVPTLAIDESRQRSPETLAVTVIDVFDREAVARVALGARRRVPPPPDPARAGDQALAEFLKVVLPDHPWACLSEETAVVRGLGVDFSLLVARDMHTLATSASGASPATISFTVNTTTSGLVLDSFPELTYAPRRFGAKASTPVTGALARGWWKFETMVSGALVRDRGRHLASVSSTSTTTGDF